MCQKDLWGDVLLKTEWLLCPVCKNKTRIQMREDTILENFLLFCPKCKQETLINVKQLNMTVIKEPNARRRADNQRD
ncbi:cysteine-rich KTR domain-containing protein [uncultured Clostridium sp.]|uniref:cysteine-rich KTR domain-containing protein n=1 Tax=uncultured Clostridium sp. TaxID=59620 RepID=UPI0028E245B1|nr:cysteine-rich KTR domain-containing protein [uncultured Clostridium sp.]